MGPLLDAWGAKNGPIQHQNAINWTCCLQGRESYLESFKRAISHPYTRDNMTRSHKSHFHAPIYGKNHVLAILGLPDGNSGWKKGPNTLAHIFPASYQPCTTLYHQFGAPRESLMASYVWVMAFWLKIFEAVLWHSGAPWWQFRMGKKGPNSSAHMFPALYQPCTTLDHQFGASRTAYGVICPIYGISGQFLAINTTQFESTTRAKSGTPPSTTRQVHWVQKSEFFWPHCER